MIMSAKIEYACRAAIELGLRHRDKKVVRIATIAKSQGIPKGFLLQLMIRLKNAGLVESTRGKAGGYILARDPSMITLADIVRAVDESLLAVAARKKIKQGVVDYLLQGVWKEANEELVRRLEGVTLEDIMVNIRGEQLSYSI